MKLNFKKLGKGSPLVILHGLFGSLDNWLSLAKEWSSNHEVWLVDQRNHGQSPHSKDISYQLMAEDLKEFILEHQIEQATVLGHSMGGKTAMEFAVNHKDLLSKLIVVDIAPVKYPVHHYAIIDALEAINLEALKSRKEADKILSTKIKEFGVRQFLLKNLFWKTKEQLAWRFNLSAIKREILPISEWSISDKQFMGDTLFIKGEKSSYILAEHGLEISKKFPNYELEEIKDAGHWVHAEKREDFSTIIQSYIAD